MIGGGLSLALVPVPLAIAALILYGLPQESRRLAQAIGAVAVMITGFLVGSNAVVVNNGGSVESLYTTPVTGIDLLVRADPGGTTLALAALAFALLILVERRRSPGETGAVMICVGGGIVAALSGNAVLLFAGMEIGNVGTLLLLCSRRRRPGHWTLTALLIEHAAALGLLAAALQLQASIGTTNFAALPAGAIGAAVGVPWALAAAVKLLSPAVHPLRGVTGSATAWLGLAALPSGAAALLRLREAAGGPLPDAVPVLLAALGAAAVLVGGAGAVHAARTPLLAGRRLLMVAAGLAVAMGGFAGTAAATAVSAGICALMLGTALAPAWESRSHTVVARGAGIAALLMVGLLPIGFGAPAAVLTVGAALALGVKGTALVVCLGAGVILAAAGAVRAAVCLVPPAAPNGRRGIPPLAAAGLVGSLTAAAVPGVVVGSVMVALGGNPGARIDAGAIVSPGGAVAGGYFILGLAIVAISLVAAANLIGVRLPGHIAVPAAPEATFPATLLRLKRFGAAVRSAGRAAAAVDEWLTVQPQLLLVVLGGLLAIVLIH